MNACVIQQTQAKCECNTQLHSRMHDTKFWLERVPAACRSCTVKHKPLITQLTKICGRVCIMYIRKACIQIAKSKSGGHLVKKGAQLLPFSLAPWPHCNAVAQLSTYIQDIPPTIRHCLQCLDVPSFTCLVREAGLYELSKSPADT